MASSRATWPARATRNLWVVPPFGQLGYSWHMTTMTNLFQTIFFRFHLRLQMYANVVYSAEEWQLYPATGRPSESPDRGLPMMGWQFSGAGIHGLKDQNSRHFCWSWCIRTCLEAPTAGSQLLPWCLGFLSVKATRPSWACRNNCLHNRFNRHLFWRSPTKRLWLTSTASWKQHNFHFLFLNECLWVPTKCAVSACFCGVSAHMVCPSKMYFMEPSFSCGARISVSQPFIILHPCVLDVYCMCYTWIYLCIKYEPLLITLAYVSINMYWHVLSTNQYSLSLMAQKTYPCTSWRWCPTAAGFCSLVEWTSIYRFGISHLFIIFNYQRVIRHHISYHIYNDIYIYYYIYMCTDSFIHRIFSHLTSYNAYSEAAQTILK